MPAAMVHGGGGVLLMMTTKQTINNHKITKQNAIKAHSITTKSNSKQQPNPKAKK